MSHRYYHAKRDVWVKIDGPNFVIMGDGDLVSDRELFALHKGSLPAGWATVESLEQLALATERDELADRYGPAMRGGAEA